jgi:NADPH:quinone reductase-like Zn-dependent oxidoreductase
MTSFLWSPSYYQLWIEESSEDLKQITEILLREEIKVEVECEVEFEAKEISRALKFLLNKKAKGKMVVKIE